MVTTMSAISATPATCSMRPSATSRRHQPRRSASIEGPAGPAPLLDRADLLPEAGRPGAVLLHLVDGADRPVGERRAVHLHHPRPFGGHLLRDLVGLLLRLDARPSERLLGRVLEDLLHVRRQRLVGLLVDRDVLRR